MPTKTPLRRQGAATRAKLLDAAVPALAAKGYHATRVDDIVRRAGVSHAPGTFYLYFDNKEDLFRTLAERCAEASALAESLGPVDSGPAGVVTVRSWLAELLALYRRYGVVIRARAENQVTDRSLRQLGAASFGRITTTLQASIAGRGNLHVRSAALLAMIERFAYVTTSGSASTRCSTTWPWSSTGASSGSSLAPCRAGVGGAGAGAPTLSEELLGRD